MVVKALEPACLIGDPGSKIRLAGADPLRSCLARKSVHNQVPEEDESCIRAACLIEAVGGTSGPLVDTHQSDIRSAPQSILGSCDREVCPRVWSRRSRVDIHHSKLELTKGASYLGPRVNRNLFAAHWIDTDLAAEEEQVRVSFEGEVENAGIFQEELSLLWEEELVWGQIELLCIDVRIGEISIDREIGNKIGAKAQLHV